MKTPNPALKEAKILILGCGQHFPYDVNAYGFHPDNCVGIDLHQSPEPRYIQYNLLADDSLACWHKFDMIICEHVLEHLSMKDAYWLLAKARAHFLSDAGELVISVPDALGHEHPALQTEHLTFFTKETLTWLAQRAGFTCQDPKPETRIEMKRDTSIVLHLHKNFSHA